MQLQFSGHRNTPPTLHLDPDEVFRRSGRRSRTGAFVHNGNLYAEGNTVWITFRPEVLVATGLDATTESDVMVHEERHHTDFVSLADRLRRNLNGAVARNPPPAQSDLDAWWAWFLYDIGCRAAAYHREIGASDTNDPPQPNQPRPR